MFNLKIQLCILVSISLMAGLSLMGCQSNSQEATVESIFDKMEQALKNGDESLFKAQWHPEGYRNNLVGGSGLAGENVFSQGNGEWFLKPDMQAVTERDGVRIIRTDIWSFEEDRAYDEVYTAVVQQDEKFLVLGAGEAIDEVEALVDRYLSGDPLAAVDE